MKIVYAFAVGLALAGTLSTAPAMAQSARTFVSGHGSDANACTLALPCRTLAVAAVATTSGGEIDILDPAGYGALNITKAISIVNDGVGTSSVLVPSGGVGITINAGTTDAISLRGLTIEGGGTGSTGIQFITGGSLTIANSVIRHVTGSGIRFSSPNATGNLSVSNTLVADNGGYGVEVQPSGSVAITADFNHVELKSNASAGILVDGEFSTGTITATVSESFAAHNGSAGFYAVSNNSRAPTTLSLFHSVAANNQTGISAGGLANSTIRIAQSMLTDNTGHGWFIDASGIIDTYGDNYIAGNGPNQGSLTTVGKQ